MKRSQLRNKFLKSKSEADKKNLVKTRILLDLLHVKVLTK